MKMYLKSISSVSGEIIRGKHHKLYFDDELESILEKKSVKKEKKIEEVYGCKLNEEAACK